MSILRKLLVPVSIIFLFSACSQEEQTSGQSEPEAAPAPAPEVSVTTKDLVTSMIDKMGGLEALKSVESIVLTGDGTRTRLGQLQNTNAEDTTGNLKGAKEIIDLEFDRAAYDYDIGFGEGGFAMHRTEVLTTYKDKAVGWATNSIGTIKRPNEVTSVNGLFSWSTQNSPEFLLRRNIITIAIAAAETASADEAAEERSFNDKASMYGTAKLGDEEIGLYFDKETGLLNGFTALDTETMLGDVEAQYILDNYQTVGNLTLPHSVTVIKDEKPYSSITYTSIKLNEKPELDIFKIPEDVLEEAEHVYNSDGSWAPVTLVGVSENVYHAMAFSHNSMVVEFPTFVVVVEGAYTEAQSLTLARMIGEQIGKPIRYVIPTHPHYDHTGGIRGLAATGATVLVAAGHERELRGIVESPHTNPPDELARRASAGDEVGAIEVYTDMMVISEGDQSLEVYEVKGIPHVEPMTLAFVPGSGELFESDLFSSGGGGPNAEALLAAVRERGLEVKSVVSGHGTTLPFSALVSAVEESNAN